MRYLLLLLVLMLTFTACSDSGTGRGNFQQKRIGTWLITSETTAKWVGGDSFKTSATASSVGDSIYYNQPDHNSLQLVSYISDDSLQMNYVFVDSAMTKAWFDSTMASPYIYPFIDSEPMGGSGRFRDNFASIESLLPFRCDSSYNHMPRTMSIKVKADTGGLYQRRYFGVQGIYQAADNMLCR